MKNLMKFLSIFITFIGIIIVITLFNPSGLNNEFIGKLVLISINSLIPFISIAICAYCMEKDDTNYLVRVIPAFLMVPICLLTIATLFEIKEGFIVDLYRFLSCSYLEILSLSLILVIKPNNLITSFARYVASGLFALQFIFAYILFFMNKSIDFANATSLLGTSLELIKIYLIVIIAQTFTILVLYLSNYAFSEKIEIEADSIDYDSVKQDALTLANSQMNSIYNLDQKKDEPDRTLSDKGLMNINNQLGQNSNVGTTKEQAREVNIGGSTLDSLMPLSKGPVVNSVVNNEEKAVVTTPPTSAPVTETIPPNLDIQEQMRLKMVQSSQQNNINKESQ